MSSDNVQQLERDVQYLKDRLEILDVVMRHARAHDRHDSDLKNSCYHDDGVDEHGGEVTEGQGSAEWADAVHAAAFNQHAHNITTHTCEIDGDVAYCESYVVGAFLWKEGEKVTFVSGRYVDQLERRNGQWKIALRRNVIDVVLEGERPRVQFGSRYLRGVWTNEDVS